MLETYYEPINNNFVRQNRNDDNDENRNKINKNKLNHTKLTNLV